MSDGRGELLVYPRLEFNFRLHNFESSFQVGRENGTIYLCNFISLPKEKVYREFRFHEFLV